MACFTAPATAAIITTIFRKKIPKEYHIGWFNTLIWGGTAGLILEHVAHGEIVPYPPFLTAMATPAETAVMLSEILSIGVPMLAACLVTWAIMVCANTYFTQSSKTGAKHTA